MYTCELNKTSERSDFLLSAILACSIDYHLLMDEEEELLKLMTDLIYWFHGDKGVLVQFVKHDPGINADMKVNL